MFRSLRVAYFPKSWLYGSFGKSCLIPETTTWSIGEGIILEKQYYIETHVDEKFRLDILIKETNKECQEIEQEMSDLEIQLAMLCSSSQSFNILSDTKES